MKISKQLLRSERGNIAPRSFVLPATPAAVLLTLLCFFPGFTEALPNPASRVDSSLTPWVGSWIITDERVAAGSGDSNKNAIVEIRVTADGKGLEISRETPQPSDVTEVLIPDGTRRAVETQNCTGWQTAGREPETGLLISSSELNCKESGTFAATTIRMIVAADKMVDILAVKAAGQTRIGVRRLEYIHDLAPAVDLQSSLAVVAARTALAAPWNLNRIIKLSRIIETPALEAALLEKNAQIALTSGALRQMQAAGVPSKIIDLLVALALPDEFDIYKNGEVALRPLSGSTPDNTPAISLAPGLPYYPGGFYNCYPPYGYPYSGLFYQGACYRYYSPFWWDYPIFIPYYGSPGSFGGPYEPSRGIESNGRLTASGGYTQIEPRDTGRHARPRDSFTQPGGNYRGASQHIPPGGYVPPGGYSGGSSAGYSSGANASSGGGSGGGSAEGGSTGASASPAGYSSGSGGGGQAVPR